MTRDSILILETPLDLATIVEFLSDNSAGGVDLFLGTTRGEKHADGRDLVALDYEAFDEMAMRKLHKLSLAARAKWPICKLAVHHRIGRVPVGEASVIIGVSCPHRGEAFDACRFLIDQLKVDVPIWKKEIWSDGSGSWVHPATPVATTPGAKRPHSTDAKGSS